MDLGFVGKRALVLSSSRGLGRAVAERTGNRAVGTDGKTGERTAAVAILIRG